jgi:hypothetical protein
MVGKVVCFAGQRCRTTQTNPGFRQKGDEVVYGKKGNEVEVDERNSSSSRKGDLGVLEK